ncbi:MAG: OmpH family outer membrane protein [Verrucomicrobia bacterium]|nr:OmpH family outer membrane protein [Verrucomicrobiota bacterium]
MKKLALSTLLMGSALFGADATSKIGIVDFQQCAMESAVGKKEEENFAALQKQISSLMEDTGKKYKELDDKLNDKDFTDGLSPEGRKELESKRDNLAQEMQRYQQQQYMVLNQAHQKRIQNIRTAAAEAAVAVAEKQGVSVVLDKNETLFALDSLNMTKDIIAKMDENFEKENKKAAETAAIPAAPADVK